MDNNAKTLAIIGGGAGGLAAAIAASLRARANGEDLEVVIYERDDRVGRTILATGNGRCNFSNARIDVDEYRNAAFVDDAFRALERIAEMPDAVHAFFKNLGLVWREEADGRQYPLANKATAVLDVLRAAAAELGVRESCEQEVAAVDVPRGPGSRFTIRMTNGVLKRSDAVILASGGRTVSALDVSDLRRRPPKPVLGPLEVSKRDKELTRELDNIRVRCDVSLVRRIPSKPNDSSSTSNLEIVAEETGELMFRKYGVSGICVFDLSRFSQPGDYLIIDLLHGLEEASDDDFLLERRAMLQRWLSHEPTYADMLRGIVLPRVSEALLKRRGIHPRDGFAEEDAPLLSELLHRLTLKVEGIADNSLCQVRRGGFEVEGFDPTTMEARRRPGIFAVGEALDIDGPCGGYNLHWAWASGLVAGVSAADSIYSRSLQ